MIGSAATSAGINAAEESGLYLHPSRYYDTLLDLCEKLFDQDLDQATFEESVRYMYGIDGYVIFTVDKVISAFVKSVSRGRASDLVHLSTVADALPLLTGAKPDLGSSLPRAAWSL